MSTVDLRELKKQAARLLEKRKYAKAAELCLQIAEAEPEIDEAEPHEPDWRQRAGEALRREGGVSAAIVELMAAAEGYAKGGFLLKAIAVCKVVLQVDPMHVATQAMLANFYALREGGRATSGRARVANALTASSVEVAGGLAAVPLDEVTGASPIPPGAPIEVVPLWTVLGGRKSAQFKPVSPHAGVDGLDAGAAAYEIVLDEGDLAAAAAARLDAVPLAAPAVAPERLDNELDFFAPLPHIPLFSSLTADQLRHVIERVAVREVTAGETIVRQGDRGGSLFVVVRGAVQVILDGPPRRKLATVSEGDFFGELALITDFPRSATVVATRPTQLLELSRELISELLTQSPEVLRTLLRFFRDRLLDRLLGSSALFASFSHDEAHALAHRFVFLEFEPKMRVIAEGERSPGLFLLLAGEVQVTQGQRRLATLTPGDVFGEMSLLEGRPAMASIDTVTKCWTIELPRERFHEIVLTYPLVLEYISQLVERRTQQNLAASDERVEFL